MGIEIEVISLGVHPWCVGVWQEGDQDTVIRGWHGTETAEFHALFAEGEDMIESPCVWVAELFGVAEVDAHAIGPEKYALHISGEVDPEHVGELEEVLGEEMKEKLKGL